MRKTRNAFFSEASGNYQNFSPNGFSAASNSSFYAGPNPMMGMNLNMPNEIEERLAKIERQINRLDSRISKIENMNVKTTEDFESTTNNMYIL